MFTNHHHCHRLYEATIWMFESRQWLKCCSIKSTIIKNCLFGEGQQEPMCNSSGHFASHLQVLHDVPSISSSGLSTWQGLEPMWRLFPELNKKQIILNLSPKRKKEITNLCIKTAVGVLPQSQMINFSQLPQTTALLECLVRCCLAIQGGSSACWMKITLGLPSSK